MIVEGTRSVLTAARDAGVPRVVHISSTAVYGLPKLVPTPEDHPREPVDPYSRARAAAEEIAEKFRADGLCVPIIRPKTFLGPGRMGLFAMLFEWAEEGHGFPILGKGGARIQMLAIDDLVDAILLVLDAPDDVAGDTYNIAAAEFATLREDFQAVLDAAGHGRRVRPVPAGPALAVLRLLGRTGLSPVYDRLLYKLLDDSYVSIAKARDRLGFAPRRPTGTPSSARMRGGGRTPGERPPGAPAGTPGGRARCPSSSSSSDGRETPMGVIEADLATRARPGRIGDLLTLLRPLHSVKSLLLVPLPLLEAGHWTLTALAQAAWAVAGFVLAGACVYIGNDLADRHRDRLHPVKRHRPIAAGRVSVRAAHLYRTLLVALLALIVAAGPGRPYWPLLAYLALNGGLQPVAQASCRWSTSARSRWGSCCGSCRGTPAIGAPISGWLVVTVFSLSAAADRRQATPGTAGERPGPPARAARLLGRARRPPAPVRRRVVGRRRARLRADRGAARALRPGALVLATPFVLYALFRYLQVVLVDGGAATRCVACSVTGVSPSPRSAWRWCSGPPSCWPATPPWPPVLLR